MNGKTILYYLDTNFRRTASETDGMFVEAIEDRERVLRCCSEEMIEAAKAACVRQKTTPIEDGREVREKMFLAGLEFTWLESKKIWSFRGEFYSIQVRTTCCQEDVTAWLEAFFVAEEESGSLFHWGAKFTHILGVPSNDSSCVAISDANEMKIGWYNLTGENRLCAAAVANATRASAHPIQLRRLIHHLWITLTVRTSMEIRETFVEDHGRGNLMKQISHLHAFRALSNEPRFAPTQPAALLTPGVSYETDTPFARVQVSAEVHFEGAQKLFGLLAEQSELFAKLREITLIVGARPTAGDDQMIRADKSSKTLTFLSDERGRLLVMSEPDHEHRIVEALRSLLGDDRDSDKPESS